MCHQDPPSGMVFLGSASAEEGCLAWDYISNYWAGYKDPHPNLEKLWRAMPASELSVELAEDFVEIAI